MKIKGIAKENKKSQKKRQVESRLWGGRKLEQNRRKKCAREFDRMAKDEGKIKLH